MPQNVTRPRLGHHIPRTYETLTHGTHHALVLGMTNSSLNLTVASLQISNVSSDAIADVLSYGIRMGERYLAGEADADELQAARRVVSDARNMLPANEQPIAWRVWQAMYAVG